MVTTDAIVSACTDQKSNLIMKTIIIIAMVYDAVAGLAYVPDTLFEYEETNLRHAPAAYVVVTPPMVPPDPFALKLAQFYDTQETYILKTSHKDATRPYHCGAILFF
jgi:hypothetical protein